MFVGFSKEHSSLVALCLNIRTGKISPQFHVVFDEKFHTVTSLPKGSVLLRDEWSSILEFEQDCFSDDEVAASDDRLPNEFRDWYNDRKDPTILDTADSIECVAGDLDLVNEDEVQIPQETEGVPIQEPEGVQIQEPEGAPSRPSRTTKTWKDGPANIRKFPIDGEEYDFSFHNIIDPTATMLSCRGLSTSQPPPQRVTKQSLHECTLLQQHWTDEKAYHNYFLMDLNDHHLVDNISDPRVYEAYVFQIQRG